MKVTTTMYAYIDRHTALTPQELQTPKGVRRLSFVSGNEAYWAENGYTYVGKAEITVEVPPICELVDNKIAALRSQAVAIRADATAKCTAIESQIQNLLAIEHSPSPTSQPSAEA